ncbi:hypothetical protein [Micromonospora sp. NPDC023956]|uniref:hypothetical protein n=1 Tax=Micromonospora sp. NPDC023956 TaxID=3155722 RepID=UPI0033DBCA7E
MTAVLRSELLRAVTLRSSVVTLTVLVATGLLFGTFEAGMWALLVGLGAFGIGVVGTTQHFQHRTAVLLHLGQPRRLRVLTGQAAAYVLIGLAVAALSGMTVLVGGKTDRYASALVAVPLMAVFGVATAAVVRRTTWLFLGSAGWFIFVEGLLGRLKLPLPFTTFLDGSTGDARALALFAGWTVLALAAAAVAVHRDLTGD